jgi:hypothetical protein
VLRKARNTRHVIIPTFQAGILVYLTLKVGIGGGGYLRMVVGAVVGEWVAL